MSSTLDSLSKSFSKTSADTQYLKPSPVRNLIFPLFFILMLATACGSSEPELVAVRGRSLELHTTHPEIVEKVAFTDSSGQNRVIRPRATNRQLVVANVTIVNRTSLITPLLIDEEAAQIGDRRGRRFDALNAFEVSRVAETADPDVNIYTPFLWGDVSLDNQTQVEGWMVFDVPKGTILGSLWWEEVDTMVADFIDYQRRRR